jgi:hypothetical protein
LGEGTEETESNFSLYTSILSDLMQQVLLSLFLLKNTQGPVE